MFTGIIEKIGEIVSIVKTEDNINFTVKSKISNELKIDQSVAHNGVCLTVVELINDNKHIVTAIKETLDKSNLNELRMGDVVNLERCMQMNGRLDGHIVQGHVDQTGKVTSVTSSNGSWYFTIEYDNSFGNVTVEKGSICVNGTSLTAFNCVEGSFTVAIIPYTYNNTCFRSLKVGDSVNLEFDILGKYIKTYLGQMKL